MPTTISTCPHCIPSGTPLNFDRFAKRENHLKQNHHKIAQQAYERGVQQGHRPPAAPAVPEEGIGAAQPEAFLDAVRPQNADMAETIYAQGFQDGRQAGKAAQNSVIKAMLDSQKLELEYAFKPRKDYGIMAGVAQELETDVGRLQPGLPQGPHECLWLQPSSGGRATDADHHVCQLTSPTEPAPATSQASRSQPGRTTRSDCENGDDVAVVKKLIKDVWGCAPGGTCTARICCCQRMADCRNSTSPWVNGYL